MLKGQLLQTYVLKFKLASQWMPYNPFPRVYNKKLKSRNMGYILPKEEEWKTKRHKSTKEREIVKSHKIKGKKKD